MSGPLIDYSLLESLLQNAFSALPLADVVSNIMAFNGRALLLLSVCLLLLKFSKGSAANRHLFLFLSLCAALCLPFSPALLPPIEIEVEASAPLIPVIVSAVNQDFISASATSWSGTDLTLLLLVAIYIGGGVLLLSKIVWENVLVWLLIKLSKPVRNESWLAALHQQTSKLSITNTVSIRYSCTIVSPLTWGIFRPVILLPPDAQQWPAHLIASTLLHELAHIRRRDWFVQQLARCICACYWINPLCWIIFRKLGNDAETACDDVVINTGIKQSYYASDLLNVARHVHNQSCRLAAIGMAEPTGTSELKRRVQAILHPDRSRGPNSAMRVVATFVIVSGFLLPLSSLRATYIEVSKILAPISATGAIGNTLDNEYSISPFDITMATITMPQLRRVSTPIDMSYIKAIAEREIRKTFSLVGASTANTETISETLTATTQTPVVRPVASSTSQLVDNNTTQNHLGPRPGNDTEVAIKTETDKLIDEIKQSSGAFPHIIPEVVPLTDSRVRAGNENLLAAFFANTAASTETIDSDRRQEDLVEAYTREKIVKPTYPRRARARGIEGEVVVEFDIDRRGNVVNPQVIQASPAGIFNSSVLKAIKRFSFSPHKINGEAVSIEGVRETFVFVIES